MLITIEQATAIIEKLQYHHMTEDELYFHQTAESKLHLHQVAVEQRLPLVVANLFQTEVDTLNLVMKEFH